MGTIGRCLPGGQPAGSNPLAARRWLEVVALGMVGDGSAVGCWGSDVDMCRKHGGGRRESGGYCHVRIHVSMWTVKVLDICEGTHSTSRAEINRQETGNLGQQHHHIRSWRVLSVDDEV